MAAALQRQKEASIAREQKAHKLLEVVDCMIADRGLTRQLACFYPAYRSILRNELALRNGEGR
jgi:hypothetical protein